MTRTEAIKILSLRDNRGLPITWQDGFVDAVDTAVEALSEVPVSNDGDTISRQLTIDVVNAYLGLSEKSRAVMNMTNIHELLVKLPSAEKTSKWMQTETANVFACLSCGSRWNIHYVSDFDYCPHCGAKMENTQ